MILNQFSRNIKSCSKILPTIYSQAGSLCVLSIKTNLMPNSICTSRRFHLWPACFKYHDLKKKKTLVKQRMDMLKARLSRLDKEDRPTGCILCPMRNDVKIDYKNTRLLSQFISPHTGRIYGKAITGLCDKKQREISKAIRRSRMLGFLPVTMKYFEYHNDPKLF